MAKIDLAKTLAGKWDAGKRPKDLFADHVAKTPRAYVDDIVAGLASAERRVQNGCAELASLLSEKAPELVAPHVGLFAKNLDADEAVLRWEAACTLGNLAKAGDARTITGAIPKLAALLDHESIVLQGHAARALAKIARVHPAKAGAILDALVAAEPNFPGSRVGYLVEAMEAFASPKLAPKAIAFAERHRASESGPVAAKAKRALTRLAKAKAATRS